MHLLRQSSNTFGRALKQTIPAEAAKHFLGDFLLFALGIEANQKELLLSYIPGKFKKKNHFRNFFENISFNPHEISSVN